MDDIKIYKNQNVYDAALERMRFFFDEFDQIVVGISGGKDSTVTLNLALKVAEERGKLPLPVVFLDQECEWGCTIEYMREVMADPRVKPYWYQMEMLLFNSSSTIEPWLKCWEEGKKWVRDKEEISIKQNVYGSDRFAELFEKILAKDFPDKTCYLSGVRCEESPGRRMGLTQGATYKWITYGKILNRKRAQYAFYPIYDWSYTDVWKAIHDNGWPYCKLYDYQYQYGIPPKNMRVSNVHHETAVRDLFFMQEVEPHTWNSIAERLSGINTVKHLKKDAFIVKTLPFMFENWKEYRDYLLENIIIDAKINSQFKKLFRHLDEIYIDEKVNEVMCRTCIKAILLNDYHSTTLRNFEASPEVAAYRKWRQGKLEYDEIRSDTYLPPK